MNPESLLRLLEKIIDRIPSTAVTALVSSIVGVGVVLLGATRGGVFAIPVGSIQADYQWPFVIGGALLFLIGVLKLWREYDHQPPIPPQAGHESTAFTLKITTPTDTTATINVPLEANGKYFEKLVSIIGSVHPQTPQDGIWVFRQKLLIDTKKLVEDSDTLMVYPADTKPDGTWKCDIRFYVNSVENRCEFSVWAVIPSRDTLLLFKDHRNNRAAFDRLEKEIKQKQLNLIRPYVPLPNDYLPSTIANSNKRKFIVKRL